MGTIERSLGSRFFRGLTDDELIAWRPTERRGLFGWADDHGNVRAANREMRRRAKKAGLASPHEWLSSQSAQKTGIA